MMDRERNPKTINTSWHDVDYDVVEESRRRRERKRTRSKERRSTQRCSSSSFTLAPQFARNGSAP